MSKPGTLVEGSCYLKTKKLERGSPTVHNDLCTSYARVNPVDAWHPKVLSLELPSTAPLLDFYMYRATGDDAYPPLDTNLASLGGLMWYLHNEVVCHCPRRNGVTVIKRYRVKTKATQVLYNKGMNFGVRHAFDEGKCTGPAWNAAGQPSEEVTCDVDSWDKYGYTVGCNDANKQTFPFPTWRVHYPQAVWYSMPGPCPSRFWDEKDDDCKAAEPGGVCQGTPTGQGNCTVSFEDAGSVRIDDVVGIPEDGDPMHQKWCNAGNREYSFHSDKGVNEDFWDGIWDWDKNQKRMDAVADAFAKKYPDMVTEKELPAPTCDFNRHLFYAKNHPAWMPTLNYTEDAAAPWWSCHADISPKKIAGYKDWR